MTLERVLQKAGLDEKYDTVNRRKITLHSFRAYFFTKAARVHDENYAHKLTGHGGYLPQYDRLTDDEKLDLYLKLESELLVYDNSKKSVEIEKLKKDKLNLEKKSLENQSQIDEIARQGQAIDYLLEELRQLKSKKSLSQN
jgi:hypothetical protein